MYAIRLVSPGIYTAKQAKNIPSIILNSLVDTMNFKAKVPHSLVIMINDFRFWNNSDLLTFQMERILCRFFKELRRIIEDRNLSLPPRAVNWDYPRLFVTRALPLPNNMTTTYPRGFKPNRRKYNKIIHRGEVQYNYRSINCAEFTSENENKLFAQDGSITHKGYRQLWIAVSDAIHKADNQDRINLNKAKAKQLSAQITVTSQELTNTHGDNSDLSDIESLQNISTGTDDNLNQPNQASQPSKTAKRALLTEFDATNPKQLRTSPANSSVSEYFTSQYVQHHFNTRPHFHRKPNQRKRKFNKTHWKNKN